MAASGIVVAASILLAHSFAFPKHDHVSIDETTIRIKVDYTIEPGALAQRTRSLFDGDSNDELDSAEALALGNYLRQSALHFLVGELNGQRLEFEIASSEVRGLELETSSSLEIAGTWVLEIANPTYKKRRNTFVLRDRHKDAALPVPVLVTVSGQTREYTLDSQRPDLRVRFTRGDLDASKDPKIE